MGKKLVVELTNRCNLHCGHCLSGRHGGQTDLSLAVVQRLLTAAHLYGVDELSFTGGEPTLHRDFALIVRETAAAGYRFALNTNGLNFAYHYPSLLPHLAQLTIITFSLDGATALTHDQLRGPGSFRRVMQAMSICVVKGIPFSINLVITRHNRHEIGPMVTLAARLGARGIRFGHCLPTPQGGAMLELTPAERRQAEAAVHAAAQAARLPVALAPGSYTTALFPCDPLQGHELNLNCHGALTLCCHLSGHDAGGGQADVAGNLAEMDFGMAYTRLVAERYRYRLAKTQRAQSGALDEGDRFPCHYCLHYYDKVAGRTQQTWPISLMMTDDAAPVPI